MGFLSSIDPITTRPMKMAGYEVMSPDGTWQAGEGTPEGRDSASFASNAPEARATVHLVAALASVLGDPFLEE